MFNIPKKVLSRLKEGVKSYKPVLQAAYTRDVNESDTVTIITDILSQVFGYDKYTEITREYQIRGTYCDLAIVLNREINILIEVKAIGVQLKEAHIKQATDYAANSGVEWVILTNGINWMIYRIEFTQPIKPKLIYKFNFLELDHKKIDDIEKIFPITKEATGKSTLEQIKIQKDALNKYMIGALILSDEYLNKIKRDLRKLSSDVKINIEQIRDVLENELIKRDVFGTDELAAAKKKVSKLLNKSSKKKTANKTNNVVNETTNNNTDEQSEE